MENFHVLDSAVDIGCGFDDNVTFHSCLTGDFRVNGGNFSDKIRGSDLADSPYRGFDFTDDSTEHAADDSTEHAADDSALDSAFDSAFDTDIGEFFFSDFVWYFDWGDEFTGFDSGLGLDGTDTRSSGSG